MIRLNLATQKRPAAAGGTEGTSFTSVSGLNLKGVLDRLKGGGSSLPGDFNARKVILVVVVGFMASYLVGDYKDGELAKLDQQIAALNAKKTEMDAELAKAKGYERVKAALEKDQNALQNKIQTIKNLVDGRQDSYKMLRALSDIIPPDVWITEFRVDGGKISLTGGSVGLDQVSKFMSNLSENIFFTELTLKSTTQERNKAGLEVSKFDLSARRR